MERGVVCDVCGGAVKESQSETHHYDCVVCKKPTTVVSTDEWAARKKAAAA